MNNAIHYSLLILVSISVLVHTSFAQDKFIVMSAKGKVEYKEGKESGSWKKVQVGQEFSATAIVKTSFASYVKLVLNNSRLVGIDENTTKHLKDFVSQSSRSKADNTNTILAYAAKQLSKSEEPSNATEFGAVRGGLEVFNATFPKYSILTAMPEFRIVDAEAADKYELTLLDTDLNVVMKQIVDSSLFRYPESLPKIITGQVYYWKVTRTTDGMTSDIQRFTVLPSDSVEAIHNELLNLQKELESMGADEVMHHLIRGVYFEQKQLFYDAYREYGETIRLAPDVQEYRDILSRLLLNLSLYNEKDYLMP